MLAIFFFCRFAATKIYALGLLGPPIISEHPSSLVARREEPATLNCRASSGSEAGSRLHIQWFKDGQPVSTAPTDPTSHRYRRGTERKTEREEGTERILRTKQKDRAREQHLVQKRSTTPTDPTSHRYIWGEKNRDSERGRKRERVTQITDIQA